MQISGMEQTSFLFQQGSKYQLDYGLAVTREEEASREKEGRRGRSKKREKKENRENLDVKSFIDPDPVLPFVDNPDPGGNGEATARVGFSHSNVLRTIIQHACLRYPSLRSCSNAWNTLSRRLQCAQHSNVPSKIQGSQKVFVLFGGETSERQVSLMSGTNIWLNLQGYDDVSSELITVCTRRRNVSLCGEKDRCDLDVIPCLLAPANGYASAELEDADQHEICRTVWTLP
ncbi:hypothetical protein GW17_00001879 [Ensete ventricosum]|nr:hypothetical protein GW17_00001879 [Ensete ventricosum]